MDENKSDDVDTDGNEDQNKSPIEGCEAIHHGPIGVDDSLLDGQFPHRFNTVSSVNIEPPVTPGENSSVDPWPRRNFVVAAAGLLVAGIAAGPVWYFGMRSDERSERNEMRENERHAREFPAPVGNGIKICEAVVGEYVPMWSQAFVSSEFMRPQDFAYGAKRSEIFRTFSIAEAVGTAGCG